MRIIIRSLLIVVAGLLAASCASEDAAPRKGDSKTALQSHEITDSRPPARIYRGYAVYGHEVRSFRPCGSEEPLWVIGTSDQPWLVYNSLELPQAPYPEVFMVVAARRHPAPSDGFGADYQGGIEIDDVLYAGIEGPRCDYNWNDFQYHAHGNEPFWSVEVSEGLMRLKMPGSDDRTWRRVSVHPADGFIRYTGHDENTTAAELIITSEPCRDSMSGSYFALAAEFRVGDEVYRGCALQGRL